MREPHPADEESSNMNWLFGGASSRIASISVQDAWERLSSTHKQDVPVLIDVREPGESGRGHARGARNIPLGQMRQRLSDISKTAMCC